MTVVAGAVSLTDDQARRARALAREISASALSGTRRSSEILGAARRLIENPARWFSRPISGIHTELYAFTADARQTWAGDPEAVTWCIGGAMQVAVRQPASLMPVPPCPLPTDWEDTPTEVMTGYAEASVLLQNAFAVERPDRWPGSTHQVAIREHGQALSAFDRAVDWAERIEAINDELPATGWRVRLRHAVADQGG
jgi:hypothetical protein